MEKYEDVFRLHLGRDPPVKAVPMKVILKKDATPIKCKSRRYPPEHREFLRGHVPDLIEAGLVFRNPNSRWYSPPLIVKKPGIGNFRMTVDVRGVNAQTERIAWPMPMLQVVMEELKGANCFFMLDFFKGYWQFLLSEECQEYFSFMIDEGIYTPTRVMMGASDSVAYTQSTVQDLFDDLLYQGLLIWINDLLGYNGSDEVFWTCLRKRCKCVLTVDSS